MLSNPDVLVLGGGVIGLTAAYFLAREGIRVTVLDQGDLGREASWAGAGILPPGTPRLAPTAYDQLRAHGAVLFPELSDELRQRTGIDNGYRRCGGLEFVERPDHGLEQPWREEKLPFELLGEPEYRLLEPELAAAGGFAYHLPGMAQVRNPRHVHALMTACTALGVDLRPGCPVYGFERRGTRISAVKTAAGSLKAGQFLLTAGAWTGLLLEPLGWKPGIHPVRGQIALLRTTRPLLHRVLLHGKRYLVPRDDGRLLVGATEEHVGYEKRTTAGAVAELLAFAHQLVPGTADATLERCWSGLRPGSMDGLPFIGWFPGCDNLAVAAGHFRAGIQLSPATGLIMKELLLVQSLTVPISDFRLDRPPTPPARLAFRS